MKKEDLKTEIVIILTNILGRHKDNTIAQDKYWEVADEILKIIGGKNE